MDKFDSNQANSSTKSIYELVQARIAAARLARRYRNSTQFISNRAITPKMNMIYSKADHNEMLTNRVKIVVMISSIVLALMIISVIVCILKRYFQDKNFNPTERIPDQRRPTQYSRVKPDNRNFARKQRTLPTAV